MSLWLESLYGYGGGRVDPGASLEHQREQARWILAHLAMPVPRMWWENALETAELPRHDYLELLRDLRDELHKASPLADKVGIPELLALAFVDKSPSRPRFGTVSSRETPEQYLAAARKLLASDPALASWAAQVSESLGTGA
jgi:hypothetical protein